MTTRQRAGFGAAASRRARAGSGIRSGWSPATMGIFAAVSMVNAAASSGAVMLVRSVRTVSWALTSARVLDLASGDGPRCVRDGAVMAVTGPGRSPTQRRSTTNFGRGCSSSRSRGAALTRTCLRLISAEVRSSAARFLGC